MDTQPTLKLALDLGTRTGWAYRMGGVVSSGAITLGKKSDRSWDSRPPALCKWVSDLLTQYGCDCGGLAAIVFEDVQFAKSLAQVQLWGSLRGALWSVNADKRFKVLFHSVPVGTLKRFATRTGDASKEEMIRAACRRYSFEVQDDNEADALMALAWMEDTIYGTK